MNRFNIFAAVAFFVCSSPQPSVAQLVNPGFEDPITTDGPPFVGSWEGFAGGAVASATNSTAMPRSGAQNLDLSIVNTNNTFAGVFQDVPVTAGEEYIVSGWHATPSNPFDVGVELRIEWRSSSAEVGRTPNQTPIPTAAYEPFTLTGTAPAGAEFARVVYAIQSFTPVATDTGTVFVDDMSFVPEPSAIALLAIAALMVRSGSRNRERRQTAVS